MRGIVMITFSSSEICGLSSPYGVIQRAGFRCRDYDDYMVAVLEVRIH